MRGNLPHWATRSFALWSCSSHDPGMSIRKLHVMDRIWGWDSEARSMWCGCISPTSQKTAGARRGSRDTGQAGRGLFTGGDTVMIRPSACSSHEWPHLGAVGIVIVAISHKHDGVLQHILRRRQGYRQAVRIYNGKRTTITDGTARGPLRRKGRACPTSIMAAAKDVTFFVIHRSAEAFSPVTTSAGYGHKRDRSPGAWLFRSQHLQGPRAASASTVTAYLRTIPAIRPWFF
jgi:hypothetical protein